ncbi:MAG TPA: cyclodeaminase/cyclohydrolase family protein [Bacillota bacterium]|nr:cyclodeaminase/cyclohydrolase family protein [Bacillota bacterium]
MALGFGQMSVGRFLDELASEAPVPGGGTAAALAGCLAAALAGMVLRLSLAREAGPAARFEPWLHQVDSVRRRLLELAEADTEAYRAVLAAYRLPRETPADKTQRRAAVDAALQQAASVPLEVAGLARDILAIAVCLEREGYRPAATDAKVAASLAQAALEGALANVTVNLESMRESEIRDSLRERAEALARS